jgi:bifunctional non-homologous end joining protein LigD
VFRGLGDAALQTSRAQNLEGVVAKRLDSLYEPGRRSQAWIKVKNTLMQSVVVGGWRTGKDSRQPTFGSLLCGVNDPSGRLVYVGRVGSGFDSESLGDLTHRLTSLARTVSPFHDTVPYEDTRDAHWVDPVLVGEVVFAGWTPDNRLWHPRWRGLRDDIAPRDVVRES